MAYTGTGPVVGPRALSEEPTAFAPSLNDAPLLPTGFPDVLDSSMAWAGTHFAKHSDFILRLNDVDVKEAEEALEHFIALELDGDLMSRQSFPLPNLGPRLDRFRLSLHDGTGFGLIRGLDPQRYAVEDLTMLHLGIQCHIANRQGRQNTEGNMLVHIAANDSSNERANHRRHSTTPIIAHNKEGGEIIRGATRSTASLRGSYIIASACSNNVLAASCSDPPDALARSFCPSALQVEGLSVQNETDKANEIDESIDVVSAQIGDRKHIARWRRGTELTYTIFEETFKNANDATYASQQLVAAIHMWGDFGVTFRRVERNAGAHFRVAYRDSPLYGSKPTFATSFLPHYTADRRTLYVYAFAFAEPQIQHLANILAHEIGHILGFRHEFALEEEQSRRSVTLGSRNPNSIMSYYPDASQFKVTHQDREEMKSFYALSSADYKGLELTDCVPDCIPYP